MAKQSTDKQSTAAKVLRPDGTPKFDKRGTKGYDPDKDPCLVGFQLGSSTHNMVLKAVDKKFSSELDAYDFYSDRLTGLRPGETKEPYGMMTTNLKTSVMGIDCLPPIATWAQGMWLWDAIFEDGFKFNELTTHLQSELTEAIKDTANGKVPQKFFTHYIVSGEGTPSNSIYRVYILPEEMGSESHPRHPMMWPEKYKSKMSSYGGGGGYGRSTPSSLTTPAPSAVQLPVPKKVHLPASMRTRCGGCGHWWAIDDVIKHANVCPGVTGQGEADMAMMCDVRCGCDTLDQASKCKPGFPRKPIVLKADEPEVAEPTLAEDLATSVTSNGAKATEPEAVASS